MTPEVQAVVDAAKGECVDVCRFIRRYMKHEDVLEAAHLLAAWKAGDRLLRAERAVREEEGSVKREAGTVRPGGASQDTVQSERGGGGVMEGSKNQARKILDGWVHRIGSGPAHREAYLAKHLDAAYAAGRDAGLEEAADLIYTIVCASQVLEYQQKIRALKSKEVE